MEFNEFKIGGRSLVYIILSEVVTSDETLIWHCIIITQCPILSYPSLSKLFMSSCTCIVLPCEVCILTKLWLHKRVYLSYNRRDHMSSCLRSPLEREQKESLTFPHLLIVVFYVLNQKEFSSIFEKVHVRPSSLFETEEYYAIRRYTE